MRGSLGLVLVLAVALTGCSTLPFTVDLTPQLGEFRSGQQVVDFGGAAVRTLDLRLTAPPVAFAPPEVPIKDATGVVGGEYLIETDPPTRGPASVAIYLSDQPDDLFAEENRAATLYLEVGSPSEFRLPLVLSEAAVRGVNRGLVYVGAVLEASLDDYARAATLTWRIIEFSLGVELF